jgi:hypothetical protein
MTYFNMPDCSGCHVAISTYADAADMSAKWAQCSPAKEKVKKARKKKFYTASRTKTKKYWMPIYLPQSMCIGVGRHEI